MRSERLAVPAGSLALLAALLLTNGLRLHFRGWATDVLFGMAVALMGLSLLRPALGVALQGRAAEGQAAAGKMRLTTSCFAALLGLYAAGLVFDPSSQGLRNLFGILCVAVVFLFGVQNGPALAQSRFSVPLFLAAALALLPLYWTSGEVHPVLLSVYSGYALLTAGILLMARCNSRRAQHFWAHAALLAAAVAALVYGVRAQVLAMLLAYPFYWGAQHLLRSRWGAGALAGGALALACLVTALLGIERVNEKLASLRDVGRSYTGNELQTGRDVLIRTSLSGILDAPWLGWGPDADVTRLAPSGGSWLRPEAPYCLKWANPGLFADCNTLLKVRNALAGAGRTMLWTWDFDQSIDSWAGVEISGEPPRIVGLVLPSSGLTGRIPAQLGELEQLAVLRLNSNRLTGPIPPELGKLGVLKVLHLDHNALTGRIPETLADLARLEVLRLERNRLSGEIPKGLAALQNLRSLGLRGNELLDRPPPGLYAVASHDLHQDLFCLPSLRWHPDLLKDCNILLEVRDALAGGADVLNWRHQAPIGNWRGVKLSRPPVRIGELRLSKVGLNGRIPPRLAELDALRRLRLNGNNLHGEVPATVGALPRLLELRLAGNSFGVPPPGPAPGAAKQDLDVDPHCTPGPGIGPALLADCALLLSVGDALAGDAQLGWNPDRPLSAWQGVSLAGLPRRIAALDLSWMGLNGRIPPQLGALSGLVDLRLSGNRLTGPIPAELSRLADLRTLRLDGNALAGAIPTALSNLETLKDLRLEGNALSGCRDLELSSLWRFLLPLQLPRCGSTWRDGLEPVGRFIYSVNDLLDLVATRDLAESSHNLFLHISLQSGLLGLGALALLCLSLIFNLRRRAEEAVTPVQCFTAACAFTAILHSAFEVFLLQYMLSAAIFAWMAMGMGTGLARHGAS